MKLPIPTKHETTVILETYSKNEIPFKFSDVQISINGPDVVVKTADGHVFTFPFAAQFATMGKNVFTLVFADGKEIPSDQLLAYATTVTAAPNAADPQAHHEVSKAAAGHDKSTDSAKESKDSKDATKDAKNDDIVVVDSTAQENAAGGNQAEAEPKQPPVVHPGDLSKHRFDDEALPHVDHISGMPPKPVTPPSEPAPPAPVEPAPPAPVEPTPPTPVDPTPPAPVDPTPPTPVDPTPPTPVDPTPPTPVDPTPPTPVDPTPPTPVDPTPPPPPTLQDVKLLQTQGVADASANVYELGGGVDAARTDGRISTQYATRDIDLSSETGNWTIHADSTVGVEQPGCMTRIINAGSVSSLTDVTIDPALAAKGVGIVLWNSPEGIALGLQSNEFALTYPTAQGALSGPFTVHLDYIDAASGQAGSSDLAFQVTAAPTAVYDQNNVYQLSSTPNDVAIHAGSGDDTLIAGHANGVYDGGGGTNTLDYSGFASALTVDLSADVRSALRIDPTGAANAHDMGKVTSSDSVQSIENFQIVIGGQGGNIFIGNQFDHQFIGGAGDNTFIAHGGNDVYTGGAGHNTLDYSHVGGTAFDTVTLGTSGLKLVLNGVDIDLANGVTLNNGWADVNGNAGTDHFSDMTQVIGSGYNDRIAGSAGNDVITGGAGNDLIIGSAGNDTIDGGGGSNTISYANLTDKVDVDLNGPTGSAVKGDGGVDSLVRIQAVIGSAGGGTLTGLVGGNNLLIGTDGDTSFVTNAGNNQLYGGAGNNTFNAEQGANSIFGGTGDNTFNLDQGNDTVHGGTANNTFNVNGGNNTLYGGASNTFALNQGSNTVYGGTGQNTVQAQGGLNTFQSGGGVNTYNAIGGTTVYNAGAGSDSFSGSNGGNNKFFGSSGNSTFSATGGGNNAISEGSGNLYVYSGGANNTVTGGGGGKTTVDYSGYTGAGQLDVTLNRDLALIGKDFVDRLYNIDVIIGARNGNSVIRGGDRGIEIHALGDNNVLTGGYGDNVLDGGSGVNNTLDYSGAAGAVDVNLNKGMAAHNGSGFVDQITGIQRIIGSNASGNVFEGKDGTNDWIDVGTGKNDKIFGSIGNDTFVSHDASNTLDYSKLTAGINFGTVAGVVQKGANGTDTLVGTFGNLIGTNYNDIIVVSGPGTVQAGGGDDTIRLTGGVFATTIDGGSGRNELDASGATGGALMAITLNADGRSGTVQGMNGANATTGSVSSPATSATTFTNIDILDTSGLLNNVVNWGSAQGVTINGNSTKQDYFFVNGGGNHIDGRYFGSGESIYSQSSTFAEILYANMKVGLSANFDSGTVSFADGRANDTIVNFSRFQGSSGNDVITGHSNQSDWITASGGNDTINAGGGTSNLYAVFDNTYRVNADFQTGTVLKYNSAGTLIGTDTVSNFQQFVGGNSSGDVVHGKDGVNMTFWMGDGGTKTLLASNASNSINGGSSSTTVDYTGMTSPITVDLSGHTVAKGGNSGTDSFSALANIIGTKGDDIFVFNAQTDVTGLGLNGNGGHDVLEKTSSTAGAFDLSTLLTKVTNIERIDFSTSSAADKITVDFTNLLSRGNETLTLSTTAKDTVTMTHNTAGDGWTQSTTTSGGHTTDTFTLGGHQLIWTH